MQGIYLSWRARDAIAKDAATFCDHVEEVRSLAHAHEVAGWAMDLSMGGAFVQAPRVFSAGRRVEAVIWLPGLGSPLRIPSVVANARTEGTGIRFIRLTELQEELLAKAL